MGRIRVVSTLDILTLLLSLLFVAIVIPTIYPTVQAAAATIDPIADTYVDEKYHWMNKDGGTLAVWAFGDKYISFIKFDLSTIPSSANIVSAELFLRVKEYSVDSNDPSIIGAHSYSNNSWGEHDLSWDTVDWSALNETATDTTEIYVDKLEHQVWFNWTIVEDVESAKGNFLMVVLMAENEVESIFFHSRETSLKPYLNITYTFSTPVGGIIWENTTWTLENSPYIITDTVQIPENVTLIIEPGVTVISSLDIQDEMFLLHGIIRAHGTIDNEIIFQGDGSSTFFSTEDASGEPFLDLDYCIIYFGGSFWWGWQGHFNMTHSELTDIEEKSLVNGYGKDVYIEYNKFIETFGFSIGYSNAKVYIRNNLFKTNLGFAVMNHYSYGESETIVKCNSFIDTWGTILVLDLGEHSGHMAATENYWGTNDTDVIDSMIYDKNDDIRCAGFIDYLPILIEPHPDTPILPLIVNFAYSPSPLYVNATATFDASASSGAYSTIVNYTWDFGDGNTITLNTPIATYAYTMPGSYNVTLTVTDEFGFQNSTTASVMVLPDETSPVINIISPKNDTYVECSVSLTFNIDEPTSWIGYSLDGQTNVTTTGNTTLTDLLDGSHYIIVYANDTVGNTGESSVVYFTVATPPNIRDISQCPLEDNILTEVEVKVNATVTDCSGEVKRVCLHYTVNNGTWFIVNMTNLEENIWNATIPTFSYCTYVNYFISAEDNVGNIITTEEVLGYQYGYHVVPHDPTLVVDGVMDDWLDLAISPLGTDPDDGWAGYADLRKFWAHMADTNLYLAIQVDWEYPVDSEPVIFTILITPENSSSWYEVTWYNASRTVLLGHGEHHGWEVPLISETGWDGILEFSVPLFFIDNPQVVTLEVDSYSSDWIWNIDLMPAPWEDPYTIPEFPSFLILPLFMIGTLLAFIVYTIRKPKTKP